MRRGSCSILLATVTGCATATVPPAPSPDTAATTTASADEVVVDDDASPDLSEFTSQPDDRYADYERRSRRTMELLYKLLSQMRLVEEPPDPVALARNQEQASVAFRQWQASLNANERGYQSALGIEAAWITISEPSGVSEYSPVSTLRAKWDDRPARRLARHLAGGFRARIDYLLEMSAQIITLREGTAPNAVPRPSVQPIETVVPNVPNARPNTVPIGPTAQHGLSDDVSRRASPPAK